MAHGEINHIEFPADDQERAKRFYSGVVGWEFRPDGGLRGLRPLPAGPGELRRRRRQAWRVDRRDVRGTTSTSTRSTRPCRRSTEPAARSRSRSTEIPGMGWFAVVHRPRRQRGRPLPERADRLTLTLRLEAHRRQSADAPRRQPLPPPGRPLRRRRRRWSIGARAAGRRRADPRARLERRVVARRARRSSSGFRGSTPPSASIRTTRPGRRRGLGRDRRARGDPRVVAIGETGPRLRPASSRRSWPSSRTSGATSRLAAETGKPAILHCRSRAGERDAQDALLAELAGVRRRAAARSLIHSFCGPLDYAEAMLELGAAISHLRARLPRRRGGDRRGRPRSSRPIGSSSRPTRRSSRRPARRAAATSRSGSGSPPPGSPSGAARTATRSATSSSRPTTRSSCGLRLDDRAASPGRTRAAADREQLTRRAATATVLALSHREC